MVCKQCGSYYESGDEICSVCGASLPEQTVDQTQKAESQDMQSERPNWGFVRSPRWPKPSFDINAVDDIDEQVQEPEPEYTQPAYQEPPNYEEPIPAPQQYQQPVRPSSQGFRAPIRQFDPQPLQDSSQQGAIKTIGSVGDYESSPAPYQGGFGRAPQRSTVYNMDDEEEYVPQPARKRPASLQQAVPSKSRMPISKQRSKTSSLRGGRRNNFIIMGATGVLIVLLLVLGVVFVNKNYSGFGGFFRNVFGGSPILKDPVVTEGKNDSGVDCYIITVYARKGNTVTLKVGDQELSDVIGSSNQKILRIPKASLLPNEPVDGTTADLVPDVRITTEDGEVFQLEIPPINVQVPALTFALTSPEGESISVSKPKIAFSGSVDAGSSVTVAEQTFTVNPDGTFTGEYTLPDVGMHTLTLEARKNGYQIMRKTLQVDYTNAEANIEWTKSSLRASESDTATVKGTVEAGATLAVTGPTGVTIGTPEVNTATGFFSFTVKMPEIGHYELQVTLTKDGKSTAGTVVVERAPEYAAYTAHVYKMDYDRMMKETLHQAAYKCAGKVSEVTQTDPYCIGKLTTDKGDILFEYHGSAATVDASDGKTYNIFGDYMGIDKDTGLPLIYAWFITKG